MPSKRKVKEVLRANRRLFGYFVLMLIISASAFSLYQNQYTTSEDVIASAYSDEVTNVTEKVEGEFRIVTEHHDNARIPFITVYKYPIVDEVSGAVVPPPVQVSGTNYYRVTSTDTAEDSGDEVCAIATGTACTGYVDESVTGFNVCSAYNPTAAQVTGVDGDGSVVFCDGAPQASTCSGLTNTCVSCPTCAIGKTCAQSIGDLYREMYVTCAAASSDVGLNGGTTTLSTSSDLSSQVAILGSSQGAYDWQADSTSFASLNIPFDSATNQTDFSGTATTVSPINTPDLATSGCQVGVCYEFNGTNEQFNTNLTLASVISDNEGTISLWARPDGVAPSVSLAYSGDQMISNSYLAGLSQAVISGQDRLWAYNYDTGEDRVGATYTPGQWTHLVWVHVGGKLRFYKDGAFVGEVESGNTQFTNQQVRIGGASAFGQHFEGRIDEVQMYPRALSPSQIAQIYADTSSGFAGPRVIHSEHTNATESWDLDVTSIGSGGAIGSTTASANTVTINADAITVSLNSGVTTLDTYTNLESNVTGIPSAGAAYSWTENASNLQSLYYPMNHGATTQDFSGNSTDGTVTGFHFSPQWQGECQVGGCMFFDGINDNINTNVPLSTFMSDTTGSISAWIKPTGSAPSVSLAYSGDAAVSSSYLVGISQAIIGGEDRLWVYNFDTNEDRVGAAYTVDQWTHIVWVHGGGRLWMYKDGALVGSVESANTQFTNQQVRVGNPVAFGQPFQGYVDEVQFYQHALSAEQVTNLYNDGNANNPGPTQFDDYEINAADVFDLTVTPLEQSGAVLTGTASSNTVTISAPTPSLALNLGGSTLSTFSNLSSVTTDLTEIVAAYNWTENSNEYMQLNIPFNDGNTLFDYSGNARNSTRSGSEFSPRYQGLCQVGGCQFFDGANDYVGTGLPLSTYMSNNEGTMSLWAKPTGSAPTVSFAYSGDQMISSSYLVGLSQAIVGGEDRLWAFNFDTAEDRIGTTYNVDEWVHLTWVHGGGQLLFYKNGVLVGSTPSGNTQFTNQLLRIGSAVSFGQPFRGYIDEVQVWDFALSASQIDQLYDDGDAGLAGPTIIRSQETVGSDSWEVSMTPIEEDGSTLSVVNAGTMVSITVPATSLNLNGGVSPLSTSSNLVPTISGIGDPQGGLSWEENGAPYLSLNYPFNLGTTQFDYSGNSYDGTAFEAAFSPQGQGFCQVGGCFFFDGINDYVSADRPLSNFMTDTEGTFSLWARPTGASPSVSLAYSGDQMVSSSYLVGLSQATISGEDRLWAYNFDTDEDRIGAPYTLGDWTHLVWVHSGGQLRFYKDGVLVGTTLSGNTQFTNQHVRIGNAVAFGQPFQGYVDEVQTWDFGLTVSQIEQLYTDGTAGVAGPSQITSSETIVADVWDLEVTAFRGDGSALSTTASTNNVTISAPSVTVQLNNGSSIIDPAVDLTSQVTGLGPSAAAYEWELNSAPWMTLNIPFNPGATQVDYSGNNFDAATNGAAYSIEAEGNCQVGGCHFYDGVNDNDDVGEPLSSIMSDTSGSISVWARPTGSAPSVSFAYSGDQIFSSSYLVGLSQAIVGGQDRLWAFNYDTDEDAIGAPYTPDQWTHLVWVHDAGQLSFYKDGALVGSTASGTTQFTNQQVRIGNAISFGQPFQGYIDEVQTWNFGLSVDQITELYNNGNANIAGPVNVVDEHVNLSDTWNLTVTPFESDGTPFAPNNSGNTTTGFINTPPNAPSLVSPADGTTTNELSPELSATYVDINVGHTGTTEFRVSTGTTTDCVNNVNVVHTGTSATTTTINETTVYLIGVVLADFTTYTWCARNYDTFDYSNGGAFSPMGEFTVDSTYSEGGASPQKQQAVQQTNPDSTPESDSSEDTTTEESTPETETPTEEETTTPPDEETPEDESSQQQQEQVEQSQPETQEPVEVPETQEPELPQQEQDEAPGDGELPPPPEEPTQQETGNLEQIIQQLQQDSVDDVQTPIEFTEQTLAPTNGDTAGSDSQQTNAQSDGRSFTIEVEDQGDEEVLGDEEELIVTGLAMTEEDRIEFSGTTSEPGTTVTLIFNNNVTVVVTSDEAGQWQTFVSAEQLGVAVGERSNVSIEAIAAKEDLVSDKVIVGQVELELIPSAEEGEEAELVAEFESVVEESELLSSILAVQDQVVEIIEEQEVVIQQTLAVTAPVVIVSSAPLWGYLPYLPTIVYHFITYLVGLVGRRKQEGERLYGQVYDSITKKPLGLAVMRIYNKSTNKLAVTKVTDKLGRYDLLLEPGEYRIEVTKPQFTFPSQIVTSGPDGQYAMIYNPETGFTSAEGTLSVPDIPIDPLDAKRHFALAGIIKKPLLLLQRVGHFLAIPVLFVGAVSSALTVVAVPESMENWILAALYIFLFALQLRLRPHIEKAWGVVSDLATSAALPLTSIQLIDPEYGKVVMSRLTDYEGRFAFMPEKGKYLLKASREGYEASSKDVSIEKEGQRIQGDIQLQQQ